MNKFLPEFGGHPVYTNDFTFLQNNFSECFEALVQSISNNGSYVLKNPNFVFPSSNGDEITWGTGYLSCKNKDGIYEIFKIKASNSSTPLLLDNTKTLFFYLETDNDLSEGKLISPSPVKYKDGLTKIVHYERILNLKYKTIEDNVWNAGSGNGVLYSTIFGDYKDSIQNRLNRIEKMLAPLLGYTKKIGGVSQTVHGSYLFWGRPAIEIPEGWVPVNETDWAGKVPVITKTSTQAYKKELISETNNSGASTTTITFDGKIEYAGSKTFKFLQIAFTNDDYTLLPISSKSYNVGETQTIFVLSVYNEGFVGNSGDILEFSIIESTQNLLSLSGYDLNSIGTTGGEETHVLTENEMPAHSHTVDNAIKFISTGGSQNFTGGSFNMTNTITTTGSKGGSQAHNNIQPYKIVMFIKFIG